MRQGAGLCTSETPLYYYMRAVLSVYLVCVVYIYIIILGYLLLGLQLYYTQQIIINSVYANHCGLARQACITTAFKQIARVLCYIRVLYTVCHKYCEEDLYRQRLLWTTNYMFNV